MTSTNQQLPETGCVGFYSILQVFPPSPSTGREGVRQKYCHQPFEFGPPISAWKAEDIHVFFAAQSQ